jgi:hypothetical protein
MLSLVGHVELISTRKVEKNGKEREKEREIHI